MYCIVVMLLLRQEVDLTDNENFSVEEQLWAKRFASRNNFGFADSDDEDDWDSADQTYMVWDDIFRHRCEVFIVSVRGFYEVAKLNFRRISDVVKAKMPKPKASRLRPYPEATAFSRTRSSFGDRTFTATRPQVWNSLPPNLGLCGLSYGQFRWLLKTFLFGQWGHGAVWTMFNCTE